MPSLSNYSFTHFSDVHLGAFRHPVLRELNLEAFRQAIDYSLREKVDFIVIGGDLFDIALPDMRIVDESVKKMREARDAGIAIYCVYGSHDYSPTETSIIDVLSSAGILHKVSRGAFGDDGKLHLEFTTDKKTGVKLTGLNARKQGLEKNYYLNLDLQSLEKQEGEKVFVFHSAIEEIKPTILKGVEAIPISCFPKGFSYYAGGHVHERGVYSIDGYGDFAYPGPLFGADYRDLEEGNQKGLLHVRVEGGKAKAEFKPITLAETLLVEYNAGGKTPNEATQELGEKISGLDAVNKIVLMKVHGELASGKPTEVDFEPVKQRFATAKAFLLNKHGLKSREQTRVAVGSGLTRGEIEEKVLRENYHAREKNALSFEKSRELLKAVSAEKQEGESRSDYDEKCLRKTREILNT